MGRHARVDHVGEHVLVVAYLELLIVWIKAETLDQLDDSFVPIFQIVEAIVGSHGVFSGRVFFGAVLGQKGFEGTPDIFLLLNLHSEKVGLLNL